MSRWITQHGATTPHEARLFNMILMKFWQLTTILCTARERERMYNYNGRVLMSVFVPSGHKLPSKSGAQMATHQRDLSSHLQNPYDVIYEDSKCQLGTKRLSYTSVTYRWIPMSLTHVWHLPSHTCNRHLAYWVSHWILSWNRISQAESNMASANWFGA